MPHVVLLGDSVFDNGAFVAGGPDVVAQLAALLPAGWRATLCASDGATTEDVPQQSAAIPEDASHLVLSVGGNDVLSQIDLLARPAASVAEALALLAALGERFEAGYAAAVQALQAHALPIVACTVYDGSLPDPVMQRLARTALIVFNDAILRVAFQRELDVVDLRLVCTEAADYTDGVEPSVLGGARIAAAVARAVTARNPAGRTLVVVR